MFEEGRAMNPAYGIFGWVVIGAMTGAIGGRIPDEEQGSLASVITGLAGATAGGLAGLVAFGAPAGTAGLLASLAGALLGAALFVFLGRKVSHLARTPARGASTSSRSTPGNWRTKSFPKARAGVW
jgi:uncharacterized membrane protein YeaQ/YmgE (transglycosylase-associated protein family)